VFRKNPPPLPRPDPVPAGGAAAWETLVYQQPTRTSAPLARFATPMLVIGIGNFGADLIEALALRLEDTNMLPARGAGTPSATLPRFMHITMPHVQGAGGGQHYADRTRTVPTEIAVQRVSLNDTPVIPNDATIYETPSWGWLRTLGAQRRNLHDTRAAARVILHNDLVLNDGSRLVSALARLMSQAAFSHVLIAAAADDHLVGTQLIGDVAGVIRTRWAHGDNVSIVALIPTATRERTPATASHADMLKAVTALEMAALTSSSKLSLPLPNRDWNPDNEERQLIDGVIFCDDDHREAIDGTIALTWGLLTSDPMQDRSLMASLTDRIRRPTPGVRGAHILPTTSLAFAREIYFPLRLIRQLRALRAVGEFLQSSDLIYTPPINGAGYNFTQGAEITDALDTVRPAGTLAWLRAYSHLTRRNYGALETSLEQTMRSYRTRSTGLVQTLDSMRSAASRASILPADRVALWGREAASTRVVEELHKAAGFSARDDGGLTLWATAAHTLRLFAHQDAISQRDAVSAFIEEHILGLALTLVDGESGYEFERLVEEYFTGRGDALHQWGETFNGWHDAFTQRGIQGRPFPTGVMWHHYQTVDLGNASLPVDATSMIGHGGAHALQMSIFPRVQLQMLKPFYTGPAESIRSSFVYSTQHIISDLFRWTDNVTVPYNLQAALTFRAAFLCFARCCQNGTLTAHEMRQGERGLFSFPLGSESYQWETLLWDFIRRYQDGRLQPFLEDKARAETGSTPILPDEQTSSVFEVRLRHAIVQVTGAQRPAYFG